MSIHSLAVTSLLGIFILGSVFPISLGVFGFVGSFLVGNLMGGLSMKQIFTAFPADLFATIAGVSYLFAIVQQNGTIDIVTKGGLRLVKGNRGIVPWLFFLLTAFVTVIGSTPPATVAIFAPIAMQLAARYSINPLLMGVMIVNGSFVGYYSPVNPIGLIVNNLLTKAQMPFSQIDLFVNSLGYFIIISLLVFVLLGGLKDLKSKVQIEEISAEDNSDGGLTPYRFCTLIGLVLLILSALVFKFHIGFAGFVIGLVLNLMSPKQEGIIKLMPWSVILLLSGIVTFVGVLEMIGTVTYTAELISKIGSPIIASLIVCYVAGILSAFASTTGMLAVIIPLIIPILQNSTISPMGIITAIVLAAGVDDLSPFSTNGALIIANAKGVDENKFFRSFFQLANSF